MAQHNAFRRESGGKNLVYGSRGAAIQIETDQLFDITKLRPQALQLLTGGRSFGAQGGNFVSSLTLDGPGI